MQHKWLLTFEPEIPNQLRNLPQKDRLAVFVAIAELLESDNPIAVHGVKKLIEKRFEGLGRQRQGNYRIFFELVSGEVSHQDFVYKGRLHLVTILHRSQAY